MSLLNRDYAVPGRLLGVYRTVRTWPGRFTRPELTAVLAPRSLDRSRAAAADEDGDDEGGSGPQMAAQAVDACTELGLLADDPYGRLTLPDGHAVSDDRLPDLILKLVFRPGASPNRDLGLSLAWLLAQDPHSGPADGDAAERVPQPVRLITGLTNPTPYRLLEYWACYLGFGRAYARRGKRVVSPDPTAYLRRALPELLGDRRGRPRPLAGLMKELADRCPVFEGGALRQEVEAAAGGAARAAGHLSGTTALGWLRLEEEGLVRLTRDADARDKLILPDGPHGVACSLVTWGGPARGV